MSTEPDQDITPASGAALATPLDGFLPRYRQDDNLWWRAGSGEQQNLFDEACDRAEAAEAEVAHLREALDCHQRPSLCGQRLVMEADLGVVRGARSREEQDET